MPRGPGHGRTHQGNVWCNSPSGTASDLRGSSGHRRIAFMLASCSPLLGTVLQTIDSLPSSVESSLCVADDVFHVGGARRAGPEPSNPEAGP